MTKKHFDKLAAICFNAQGFQHVEGAIGYIVRSLADICAADNPNFDRVRFGNACLGFHIDKYGNRQPLEDSECSH